jgi:hypothetical protein
MILTAALMLLMAQGQGSPNTPPPLVRTLKGPVQEEPASRLFRFQTGTDFAKVCADNHNFGDIMYCLGFVKGAIEGSRARLCTPPDQDTGEFMEAAALEISASGSLQRLKAGRAVAEALKKKYPCR